ncbi:MAG: nitroreductase family protein [Bacteroidales bacterium]|nr:nitroreductase family protein [Bacteroidales bacterium]
MDTIFKHRSVRKYKTDNIPAEILEKIVEAGSRASTTGNMQVYSIIISKEKEQKEKLWEAHFKQDMVKSAPVHLTFCADFNRFSEWCKQREAIPGYNNFLSFMTATIDAILASQNVVLEAEAHDLGACYLGTATYNADKIIDILQLPKLVVPVAAIVLGYPDEDPLLTDRLPMEAILHSERYKTFTSKRIDSIYKQREESEESQKLLEINSKKTLAQIFTDNRYKKEDNEFFSAKYLEVIRKQGFFMNE